eukprot:s1491_g12.t1
MCHLYSAVARETLRPDLASPSCESINQPQPLQRWCWHLLRFANQARLSRDCLLSFQIPEALISTTAEVFPLVFSSQQLQTLQHLRDLRNVHCSSCAKSFQMLPDACPQTHSHNKRPGTLTLVAGPVVISLCTMVLVMLCGGLSLSVACSTSWSLCSLCQFGFFVSSPATHVCGFVTQPAYRLWMPFQGGSLHVFLQGIGWSCFALLLMQWCASYYGEEMLLTEFPYVGDSRLKAAFGLIAQVTLGLSAFKSRPFGLPQHLLGTPRVQLCNPLPVVGAAPGTKKRVPKGPRRRAYSGLQQLKPHVVAPHYFQDVDKTPGRKRAEENWLDNTSKPTERETKDRPPNCLQVLPKDIRDQMLGATTSISMFQLQRCMQALKFCSSIPATCYLCIVSDEFGAGSTGDMPNWVAFELACNLCCRNLGIGNSLLEKVSVI